MVIFAINNQTLMHLQSILLLIPSVTGLFWLLAYLVFAPRDIYFRKLKRFIALLSCFFLFAFLSSNTSSRLMLHFVLIEQVCALALVPCFISYIKSFRNTVPEGLFFKLCSFVPFMHLVVGIESVYTAGFENAVRIYLDSFNFVGPMFPFLDDKGQVVFYASFTYMFRAFLLVNFLLFAIEMMSSMIRGESKFKESMAFIFAGHRANLVPVQYYLALVIFLIIVPATVLGKNCYSGNIFITAAACVLTAVALTMMALVGSAGPMEKQSISGILETIRLGNRR